MRNWTLLSSISAAVLALAAETAVACPESDAKEIKEACMNYVEGFYQSSAARIQAGVHPDLAKRSLKGNELSNMTRQDLIKIATSNKFKMVPIAVEVLDLFEKGGIATAKITSDYVDYAHLAKIDGKWQVVNVLWAPR